MNTLTFILKYIHYLLTSKGKHSIQGPFIFEFVSKVINEKMENEKCKAIQRLRSRLCKDEKIIQTTDFGAGSNINKSRRRKVKDIAKYSAKNVKFGKLLYRMIKYYNPKNILELGTSFGISTCYLAKANPDSKILTFEGCPETAKIARQNFDRLNIKNVKIILGDFNATLKQKLIELQTIDFAFIDGNHQEKPTIQYFEECLKHTHNNTLFVFDDIHWSEGMDNAWKYIKKHKKTTVTIDLFFIGIVFIKKELSKENFKIRF